jgi:preprotein translocase subunit SecE
MAEDKIVQSESKAPAKKKKRLNKIAKWFREMKSELKKVVWPTWKQIANNTLVALVVMIVAAIFVWGFDQIAAQAVRALISLGG